MAATVKLPEILDFQATGHLAETLGGKRGAVALDATAVTHLSALAAQLLLSAARAAKRRITVVNPSDGFTAGLLRLGIDPDELS
jgi:anti-anti-sigma regulatory factor